MALHNLLIYHSCPLGNPIFNLRIQTYLITGLDGSADLVPSQLIYTLILSELKVGCPVQMGCGVIYQDLVRRPLRLQDGLYCT